MKYAFTNNLGETIELDGSLTIADLVKLGVRDIKLERPDKPLKDHWFAHTPIKEEAT